MIDQDRVVAVGLLTGHDLARLGPRFARAFPLTDNSDFADVLQAIDEAERSHQASKQHNQE
jgi:hypothetical protein